MKNIVVPVLFLFILGAVHASEWYRSTPGGIALESIPSVLALRENYVLEVLDLAFEDLPVVLQSLAKDANRVAGERLYHEKKVVMNRYKLYDSQNRLLSASQFSDQGYSWIEKYDTQQRLREEQWSIEPSTWFRREFAFVNDRIAESRTFIDEPERGEILLFIDLYRYDRSGFLRSIERRPSSMDEPTGTAEWFSRNVESLTSLNRPGPGSSGTGQMSSFIKDGIILYSLDANGRVIREQQKNADGILLFERTNVWEKDRLRTVLITEQDRTTRIEYNYDSKGNRISEQYYSGIDLVRQVLIEGNKETEELYDKGKLILRTIWMDGVKQSEERPRRGTIKS